MGPADYALAALQGVVSWLALSRAQNAGLVSTVPAILFKALTFGSLAGLGSLFLMGAIYARIVRRPGDAPLRNAVFHVLAYGGVPAAASLAPWLLTAVIAGETTFAQSPGPEVESFPLLLARMQFIAYVLLLLWSIVLQIMGFSEIQNVAPRKALATWVIGQLIGFLALLVVAVLLNLLLPAGAGP